MSIICKVCNTEFAKIIPWQHLKKHEITTADYKKQHGSVYSEETLRLLSERPAPTNKGCKMTDPIHLANMQRAVDKREERFRAGEIKRGTSWSEEQKQHLSKKTTDYAITHPDSGKERAAKSIQTKIKNGYDFGAPMRDKHHSEKTKLILSESAKITNIKKSNEANERISERISSLSLVLMSDISQVNLDLKCNICDSEFTFTKQYFHLSKFKESMCPTCFPRAISRSAGETELFDFIKNICSDSISSYRETYHSKEIDVFVPSKNIGFEYNGLYWHSESVLLANNRSGKSDFEKQLEFASKGIQIIQIFEDEWLHKRHVVESRVRNILGVTTKKIYARNCDVRKISGSEAAKFAEETHIMGRGRSNARFGLFYDNKLVSVMTFTNSNISRKMKEQWELNRFSSDIDTTIVGGASKLFSAFVRQINPDVVISYSDNRWSIGNLSSSVKPYDL